MNFNELIKGYERGEKKWVIIIMGERKEANCLLRDDKLCGGHKK
jgi:hypothetical protein